LALKGPDSGSCRRSASIVNHEIGSDSARTKRLLNVPNCEGWRLWQWSFAPAFGGIDGGDKRRHVAPEKGDWSAAVCCLQVDPFDVRRASVRRIFREPTIAWVPEVDRQLRWLAECGSDHAYQADLGRIERQRLALAQAHGFGRDPAAHYEASVTQSYDIVVDP
jgi:hypothetical protein